MNTITKLLSALWWVLKWSIVAAIVLVAIVPILIAFALGKAVIIIVLVVAALAAL